MQLPRDVGMFEDKKSRGPLILVRFWTLTFRSTTEPLFSWEKTRIFCDYQLRKSDFKNLIQYYKRWGEECQKHITIFWWKHPEIQVLNEMWGPYTKKGKEWISKIFQKEKKRLKTASLFWDGIEKSSKISLRWRKRPRISRQKRKLLVFRVKA